MERRDFIGKSIFTGLACSCISSLKANVSMVAVNSDNTTPCNEKMDFVKIWVGRFFNVLEAHIDEETRGKIMRHNGKVCYEGAHGEIRELTPRNLEEIDASLVEMQEWLGEGNRNPRREHNIIYFNYVRNPNDLKIADGYCLCPVIEDGPVKISSTYCQCSVGYVEQMFRKVTGREVSVTLLESLRTGGKQCRFKIEMPD